jgi:cobalt-zinc-cadmium efflux system outer membrane protein
VLFSIRCNARRLLALALACWVLPGHAQTHLGAEDAVALALAQPHVRQDADASLDIARSEVLAARIWPNPTLELSRETGGGGPAGETRETTAVLSQTVELGGRRGLRRDAAEQGVRAAQAGVDYERARLRADVLRAYSAAVAGERRKAAFSRAASGLGELARIADKRQQAGDLSGYERRRIAQASAQAAASAAQAEAGARSARARLSGWIGERALTAELDATPPLPAIPDARGALQSAELDVLAAQRTHAEAQARAERRAAVPLTLGFGTKRVEEAGQSDQQVVVELGVPLPLFDRNQSARLRADAEAARADAAYRRATLHATSVRAAALEEARALSLAARGLFDTAVPEAARLTAIAEASFAEGELDLVGLLDAYRAETEVLDQALDQQERALASLLDLHLTPTLPKP